MFSDFDFWARKRKMRKIVCARFANDSVHSSVRYSVSLFNSNQHSITFTILFSSFVFFFCYLKWNRNIMQNKIVLWENDNWDINHYHVSNWLLFSFIYGPTKLLHFIPDILYITWHIDVVKTWFSKTSISNFLFTFWSFWWVSIVIIYKVPNLHLL